VVIVEKSVKATLLVWGSVSIPNRAVNGQLRNHLHNNHQGGWHAQLPSTVRVHRYPPFHEDVGRVTHRRVDDITGKVITEGRAYEIGINHGDSRPYKSIDVQDLDNVLEVLREALSQENASPPIQINVMTWTLNRATGDPEHWSPGQR
jgi:hypothetical protein